MVSTPDRAGTTPSSEEEPGWVGRPPLARDGCHVTGAGTSTVPLTPAVAEAAGSRVRRLSDEEWDIIVRSVARRVDAYAREDKICFVWPTWSGVPSESREDRPSGEMQTPRDSRRHPLPAQGRKEDGRRIHSRPGPEGPEFTRCFSWYEATSSGFVGDHIHWGTSWMVRPSFVTLCGRPDMWLPHAYPEVVDFHQQQSSTDKGVPVGAPCSISLSGQWTPCDYYFHRPQTGPRGRAAEGREREVESLLHSDKSLWRVYTSIQEEADASPAGM
ncbi:hypothetical protein Dimus_013382 [Dionaea muscipula]